jgi:hypothetical protein
LTFLHEQGAHEAIVKLAGRNEPGIVSRLAQLFELRAVALNRPDLVPVAQAMADQIMGLARGVPFRSFLRSLPIAAQSVKPTLELKLDDSLRLRKRNRGGGLDLQVVVRPVGLVPAKLEAILFPEDDVTFEDGNRRRELSQRPVYFATDFTIRVRFGDSWFENDAAGSRHAVRVRIAARTVTDDLIQEDVSCDVRRVDRARSAGPTLDTDTILESYPGVTNTPAIDEAFVGRIDELERLQQVLVSANRPSPVLLTGMRRIGKTSLLRAFHRKYSQSTLREAATFYLSLAERRVELAGAEQTVAATIFRAISHALVRQNLTAADLNHDLCTRIRTHFGGDWRAARKVIQECYDEESLADSLMALCARLLQWLGEPTRRIILLIDEAEVLVAPYHIGGRKKLELEQLLQSRREVSQTTGAVGLLLSGSNHINVFARQYKNAFFGSSQVVELEGFRDTKDAATIVSPPGLAPFVQFDMAAIGYARNLCAGMPQFLWQIGATTSYLVRSGPATQADVRAAVAMLVGERKNSLPLKSYEILEPIESMLSLQPGKEPDLLWMLLFRIADASSLVAEDATIPFVIDQALTAIDDRAAWKRRLTALIDLKILRMSSQSSIQFEVPLFAEGFRAPKNWQEFHIKQQQVGI